MKWDSTSSHVYIDCVEFLIEPLEKINVALYADKNGRNHKAFDRAASAQERAWTLKLQSLFPRAPCNQLQHH